MFAKLAFRLASTRLGKKLSGRIFTRMSFLLPVNRLKETDQLIAFWHPKPAYPLHILIVPKEPLVGIQDLTEANGYLLVKVFQLVQELVAELELGAAGYRLVVNGGKYQEIPHLHFHLVSESDELMNFPEGVGRLKSDR